MLIDTLCLLHIAYPSMTLSCAQMSLSGVPYMPKSASPVKHPRPSSAKPAKSSGVGSKPTTRYRPMVSKTTTNLRGTQQPRSGSQAPALKAERGGRSQQPMTGRSMSSISRGTKEQQSRAQQQTGSFVNMRARFLLLACHIATLTNNPNEHCCASLTQNPI